MHVCVLGHNSHKTSPFSSKMRTGLVENDEVGLQIIYDSHPRLYEPS